MDVRFPLPDGFVDLDARLVVRSGSVARLSALDARLLGILFAHERRAVSLDLLTQELWGSGGDDELAAIEVVVAQLREVLEPRGGPKVLRSTPGLGVGLWPGKGSVPTHADGMLAVLVLPAGELLQRDDPAATELRWAATHEALAAAAAEAGLTVVDTPGRLLAVFGDPEPCLTWVAEAAPEWGLACGLTRARWAAGARQVVLDEAVERAWVMASGAAAGQRVFDERAVHLSGGAGALVRCGRMAVGQDGVAEPVWCAAPVPAPLLPRQPRSRVQSLAPVYGRDDEVRAVLAALEGGVGVVAVHGAPGSGTTTVAMRVAEVCQCSRRGRGDVHVVWLPSRSEGRSLASMVAASLGLSHAASGRQGVGRALAALGELLVVIDGAEGTDDESTTLLAWRRVAPACSFVLTSRRAPKLPGGVLVKLDPLPGSAARALLRHRTRSLAGWEDVENDVLDKIIGLTGNSPSTLVLVAGHARTQRPERLLQRLRNETGDGRTPTYTSALAATLSRLPGPVGLALQRLTILPGPFSVGEVGLLVDDLELEGSEVVLALLDAGLLTALPDADVGEARFALGSAAREAASRGLTAESARELDRRHLVWVATRGGVALRALFRAGQDRWAIQQISRSQVRLLRAACELVDDDPELASVAVRALFVSWRLGRVSTEALADCAAAVGVDGPSGATLALMRAQMALAKKRTSDALPLLETAVAGPPGVADMARVLAIGSSRGPRDGDRRRRLAAIVHRALEDVGPERLGWVWDLVQVLLQRGMYGDAAELASRYVAVAAELGSDMLRAGLTRLAWRARGAQGRARPEEWGEVSDALRVLARMGSHLGVSEGLQDLTRHMAAIGRPELALQTLDRVQVYIDAFGSTTVKRTLHVDRARALAQLGRHDDAAAQLDRYGELRAVATGGPTPSMDQTLLALTRLDFDGASSALDRVEADAATSETSRRWCALLRAVVDLGHEDLEAAHGRIEGVRPLWPGEIVMRELVEAWIEAGGPSGTGIARAEAHIETRSVGLTGVVLRATLATARRLAEPTSGR